MMPIPFAYVSIKHKKNEGLNDLEADQVQDWTDMLKRFLPVCEKVKRRV